MISDTGRRVPAVGREEIAHCNHRFLPGDRTPTAARTTLTWFCVGRHRVLAELFHHAHELALLGRRRAPRQDAPCAWHGLSAAGPIFSRPLAVNATRNVRPSVGCRLRLTKPRSSSRSIEAVIEPLVSRTLAPMTLMGSGPLNSRSFKTAKSPARGRSPRCCRAPAAPASGTPCGSPARCRHLAGSLVFAPHRCQPMRNLRSADILMSRYRADVRSRCPSEPVRRSHPIGLSQWTVRISPPRLRASS